MSYSIPLSFIFCTLCTLLLYLWKFPQWINKGFLFSSTVKQREFDVFDATRSNFSPLKITAQDFGFLGSALSQAFLQLCTVILDTRNYPFGFFLMYCVPARHYGTVGGAPCNVTPSRAALISSGAQALNSRARRLFQNETENGDRGRELSGTDSVWERVEGRKKKKKNSDRRSFQCRLGKIKSSAGRGEGRCYRRALISFTDECEMAPSVVRPRARRHYWLLYPDLLFFSC